jgi:hypothetical protein
LFATSAEPSGPGGPEGDADGARNKNESIPMNTHTLIRSMQLWLVAALLVAANRLPGRAAEFKAIPKTLDAYVGQYDLEPGKPLIIRRKGDGIVCQISKEGVFDLTAKSETDFTFKELPEMGLTFIKDAKGKVTYLVFHKGGGNWDAMKTSDRPAPSRKPDLSAIPPRDPKARPNLVDLSAKYNARLDEAWHPDPGVDILRHNHLGAMPRGVQLCGGVEFDVRGAIRLDCARLEAVGEALPKEVKDLKVGRKCHRLHFLQGAEWRAAEGAKTGAFVLHYAGGKQAELPVVYGDHVRDWWSNPSEPKETRSARVAWTGSNAAAERAGASLRIFSSTRDNPHPEQSIESIDFVSAMADSAPFLIAITVE